MSKKRLIVIVLAVAVLFVLVGVWRQHVSAPTTKTPAATTPSFNKALYSTTDPTSLWVIVNKQHPLNPISYAPSDLTVPDVSLAAPGQANMQLRAPAAAAVETMFAAAKQQGIDLVLQSGYRSYSYQISLYNGYVSKVGQAAADAESARPGYSEHQTGLALDISASDGQCTLEACFGTTPTGEWLAANAYHYGFLLRYSADKVDITGYEYEPWHFRFVGTDLSNELHKDNIQTLEEFFGISGGAIYR